MLLNILILSALILTLLVVVGLIAHILIRVPYVPTPNALVDALIQEAHLQSGQVVYDLGAGDGRFLFQAKRNCPGIKAIGVEFIPSVWAWGNIRRLLGSHDVTLRWGDLFRFNYGDADVVFLYLYPEVLKKLQPKFDHELKTGTTVISHAFEFTGRTPQRSGAIQLGKRSRKFYVYKW